MVFNPAFQGLVQGWRIFNSHACVDMKSENWTIWTRTLVCISLSALKDAVSYEGPNVFMKDEWKGCERKKTTFCVNRGMTIDTLALDPIWW